MINLPSADRRRQIFHIALPIMGGMASQNILNVVDTAMVGSLGDAALAAAGVGSFANFMCIALIMGISTGVQAMAARRLGEGRDAETAIPLTGGLLLVLLAGIPLMIALLLAAPSLFAALNSDTSVREVGIPYLEIRVASMIAVGMNFAYRGYLSAVHQTQWYLRTIVLMHALNIFLNWVLIFGNLGAPALGLYGAGLATTISLYIGTMLYTVIVWRKARDNGFLKGVPQRDTMMTMIRVSIPSGIQQFLFAGGMVALFWIIGQIGTAELAAANVLMTLMLVGILPGMAFGISAATLVGNALGRGQPEDAKLWCYQAAWMTAILIGVLGLIMAVFHQPILGIFIENPDTLALAIWPLLLTSVLLCIDSFGMVCMQGHYGAGDAKRVMLIAVTMQWVVFLPTAYWLGPVAGYGLLAIWIWQAVYRTVQSGIFVWSWHHGSWASKQV